MNPETLFSAANITALAGWLILAAGIVLKRPLLRDKVAGLAVPLVLSLVYVALIALYWSGAEGGFDTLANVQKLFTSPWAALAGWIHYLAFDLFIGALLSRRIVEAGLPRLVLVLVLPLTFLFGPIGFALGQLILLTHKPTAS